MLLPLLDPKHGGPGANRPLRLRHPCAIPPPHEFEIVFYGTILNHLFNSNKKNQNTLISISTKHFVLFKRVIFMESFTKYV